MRCVRDCREFVEQGRSSTSIRPCSIVRNFETPTDKTDRSFALVSFLLQGVDRLLESVNEILLPDCCGFGNSSSRKISLHMNTVFVE